MATLTSRGSAPSLGLPLVAVLVSSLVRPAPAQLQVYAGVDATLASPYVWRGLTRANGFVVQPGGYLSAKVGTGFVSGGVWLDYELGTAGPGDLSDLGARRPGLGERDYWAQYQGAFGYMQMSLGVIRYTGRGVTPASSLPIPASTTEAYGSLRFSSKYLAPKLTGYWDVDRVKGLYLEASGTVPVMGNPYGLPFWAIYVQGLVGYSLGQEVNVSEPAQGANFARSGFTHVDLSLSFDLKPGPLTVHQESHLQFSVDQATRRSSADPRDADRSLKGWFGISLNWIPRVLK